MSICFPRQSSQTARENSPSSDASGNNKKIEKASRASDDDHNEQLEAYEDSSSIFITESDSSDDAPVKPPCPPTVNQIINTLSAVGTLGGLALIITGGMGMTLNKPIDNTAENMAMVLSGGALLAGSLLGNVVYGNREVAQS